MMGFVPLWPILRTIFSCIVNAKNDDIKVPLRHQTYVVFLENNNNNNKTNICY